MKKIIILLALILLSVSFSFAQDTKERYSIKHLDECNDELSNFGTSFYGENQMIYASPREKTTLIKNIWNPNQQPFLELYIADIAEDGELVNRVKINEGVNSRFHESNVAFTNDMKTVYFSRDKYYSGHLDKDDHGKTHIAMYRADVVSPGVWDNIVEMPFNNKNYCVGHPALSEDNKTLYFSSELNGSDDIYRVSINHDGTYGEPVNLGSLVNTSGSERFPFVDENNILYFASDKDGGYGKLDIYAIRLDGKSEAINLGEQINSIEDDFSFTKKRNADYGYFTSKRSSGKGDDDIYYFKELEGLPCTQLATGIVTNKITGRRIPGALVVLYDAKGNEIADVVVGENARFSFDIDCSSSYKVEGSKEGYTIDYKEFKSSPNLKLALDLSIDKENFPSEPILAANNPYTPSNNSTPLSQPSYDSCQSALDNLNTIYFDLDKDYIRQDAAAELEKVIRIMHRCPTIIIETSSHTDSRASHAYNDDLSQRRANSTMAYIISGGVDTSRITAKGYGETRLRNKCADNVQCTESEHQLNRRTQFEITNY